VEEVLRLEEPLLILDGQPALPGEHQDRFLLRLGVVETVRLARLQDVESDAVHDEPAAAGGFEARAGVLEPRLRHGATLEVHGAPSVSSATRADGPPG
jgi:hypothetical protein